MRRFTAVFLGLILSAGISLGQEADTSNAVTKIQQVQETASVVRKECEVEKDPKWAIGFRASSITNLPGTIIMQRKVYSKGYLSLGVEYNNNPRNYYSTNIDSPYYYTTDEKANGWSIRLNPELLHEFYKNNLFNAFSGVSATYYYGKGSSDYNQEQVNYPADTTECISTSHTKYYSYTIAIPVGLERDIMIGKRSFSVGVESTFLSYYYYYNKREGTRKYSDSDYTGVYKDENETPWQFSVKNPFQSGVNIKIKYCF
ncbi:MAG: hypothetical protein RDU76_00670 [Candidatus Edwardsbacteria bacterium]|nr:hypothetical protein [Candidatus Edwardsbacteria bacterium]